MYVHIHTYKYILIYTFICNSRGKKDDPKIHSIYLTLVQWKGYGHSPCTVENLHTTTSQPSAYVNSHPGIKNTVVPSTMCVWTAWVYLYDIVPHTQYSTQSISTGAYIPNTRDWNQETPDFVNRYCVGFVWDILCINQRISKTPYISTYFLLHTTLFHVFSLQNSVFKNNNYEKKYM